MKNMITINHCKSCRSDFIIPKQISDGLSTTMFVCPDCHSHDWVKISDFSIMKKEE